MKKRMKTSEDKTTNQIDDVLIEQKYQEVITNVTSVRSRDCSSDNFPVRFLCVRRDSEKVLTQSLKNKLALIWYRPIKEPKNMTKIPGWNRNRNSERRTYNQTGR